MTEIREHDERSREQSSEDSKSFSQKVFSELLPASLLGSSTEKLLNYVLPNLEILLSQPREQKLSVEQLSQSENYSERAAANVLKALLSSDQADKQAIGKQLVERLTRADANLVVAALSNHSEESITADFKRTAQILAFLEKPENAAASKILSEMYTNPTGDVFTQSAVRNLLELLSANGKESAVAQKWIEKLNDPQTAPAYKKMLERTSHTDSPVESLLALHGFLEANTPKAEAKLLKALFTSNPEDAVAGAKLMELSPFMESEDVKRLSNMLRAPETRKDARELLRLDIDAEQLKLMLDLAADTKTIEVFKKLTAPSNRVEAAEILGLLTGSGDQVVAGQNLMAMLKAGMDAFAVVRHIPNKELKEMSAAMLEYKAGGAELIKLLDSGSRKPLSVVETLGPSSKEFKELLAMLGSESPDRSSAAKKIIEQHPSKIQSLLKIRSYNEEMFKTTMHWLGSTDRTEADAALTLMELMDRGNRLSRELLKQIIDPKTADSAAKLLSIGQKEATSLLRHEEDAARYSENFGAGLKRLREMIASDEKRELARSVLQTEGTTGIKLVEILGSSLELDKKLVQLLPLVGEPKLLTNLKQLAANDEGASKKVLELLSNPKQRELGINILSDLESAEQVRKFLEILEDKRFQGAEASEVIRQLVGPHSGGAGKRLTEFATSGNESVRAFADRVLKLIANVDEIRSDSRNWSQKRDELAQAGDDVTQALNVLKLTWEPSRRSPDVSKEYPKLAHQLHQLLSKESTSKAGEVLMEAIQAPELDKFSPDTDEFQIAQRAQSSAQRLLHMLASSDSTLSKPAARVVDFLQKHPEHKNSILSGLSNESVVALGDMLETHPRAAAMTIERLPFAPMDREPSGHHLLQMLTSANEDSLKDGKTLLKMSEGSKEDQALASTVMDRLRTVANMRSFLAMHEKGEPIAKELKKMLLSHDRIESGAGERLIKLVTESPALAEPLMKLIVTPERRNEAVRFLHATDARTQTTVLRLPERQRTTVFSILSTGDSKEISALQAAISSMATPDSSPYAELLRDLSSTDNETARQARQLLKGENDGLELRATLNLNKEGQALLSRLQKMQAGEQRDQASFVLGGGIQPEHVKAFLDEIKDADCLKKVMFEMGNATRQMLLDCLSGNEEQQKLGRRLLKLVTHVEVPVENIMDLLVAEKRDVKYAAALTSLMEADSTRAACKVLLERSAQISESKVIELTQMLRSSDDKHKQLARRILEALGHSNATNRDWAVRQIRKL